MNIILMFVVFSAGVIALTNPSFGPVGEEVTLNENIPQVPESAVQIKTLSPGNISAPNVTGSPPGTSACPKYTQLDDPNSCRCTEVIVCAYSSDFLSTKFCYLYDRLTCSNNPSTCSIQDRNRPSCDRPEFEQNLCSYYTGCPNSASGNNGASCPSLCYEDLLAGKCKVMCIAKPIIYLYPEKKINVDVTLQIPGYVTVSDPLYNNGWYGVTAHPDGTLFYKGKQYPYLYYETAVTKPQIPEEGFVIASSELETKIREILAQFGLIKHEQDDFLEYWIPKLQELNSPYIFMTVLDQATKDSIDHVEMTPNADTRIEIIAEFRPLSEYQEVPKLNLPKPPLRRGFTMVEWGGAIDQ